MYHLSDPDSDLHLRVHPQGAELTSLQYQGTEYLWQADPAIWGRHAPVLFPIVGRLRDDRYTYGGQTYHLGQHGFARDRAFACVTQEPGRLVLRLRDDETTRAVYPFAFVLDISYAVQGQEVTVGYRVHNPGPGPLPFSIGAHPGFILPLPPDEQPEGYAIGFDQVETAERHLLQGGLFDGRTAPCLAGDDRIPWHADLFAADAIVLHNLRSDWVSLQDPSGKVRVAVSLAGFPFLGIWAKPGAPFVCLEPWQGLADYIDASGDLLEKTGIIILPAGMTHEASYRIRVA